MAEKALLAAAQTVYVEGVSTRKVEQLMATLGMPGVDKSQVSRICKELDEAVHAFVDRPLEAEFPYLWLDATYLKVRQNHRIVSMAGVVAIGVSSTGDREVPGFGIGASEEASFWVPFLRNLVERNLVQRNLHGVQLVISDAHLGLKAAISQVLIGATWQRCRVHLMRNVLAHVSKGLLSKPSPGLPPPHHAPPAWALGGALGYQRYDKSPESLPGPLRSLLSPGFRHGYERYPHGNSNPGRSLERAVS